MLHKSQFKKLAKKILKIIFFCSSFAQKVIVLLSDFKLAAIMQLWNRVKINKLKSVKKN